MGQRRRTAAAFAALALAAVLAACGHVRPAPTASPTALAPTPTPSAIPSPTPTQQVVRGVFMLAFESYGPRCDPLLRQWHPDGSLAAEYIVDFEGDWQQTVVDRTLEWTSPQGAALREGDLVDLLGTVEDENFCGPGSGVLHAESMAPVLPTGTVAASVSLGGRPYLCMEGCVQWISFERDGDLVGQRAMRGDDVWHMEAGTYELTLVDAACQSDGWCISLRPSNSCTATVVVPAAPAIQLVIGFQSDSTECAVKVDADQR